MPINLAEYDFVFTLCNVNVLTSGVTRVTVYVVSRG